MQLPDAFTPTPFQLGLDKGGAKGSSMQLYVSLLLSKCTPLRLFDSLIGLRKILIARGVALLNV